LYGLFKEFKSRNPEYAGVMADFVPLDDKIHVPVQAADVSAWATFQFANEMLSNPTPDGAKRLGDRMYKIVNWLDASQPLMPDLTTGERPAKAAYAP